MAQTVVVYACIAVCLLVVGVISDEAGSSDLSKEPDFIRDLPLIKEEPSVPKIDAKPAPFLPTPPEELRPISVPKGRPRLPPLSGLHPPPPVADRATSCPRRGDHRDERRPPHLFPSPPIALEPPHLLVEPPHPALPVLTSAVDVGPTREKRQATKDEESSEVDAILSSGAGSDITRGDGSKTVNRNITQLLDGVTARDVDLCFLVDVTGSMQSYINGVRDAIFDIVESLTNTTDGLAVTDLRMAFVGYRDFGDGEKKHFTVLDFTRDVETFHQFVSSTPATGGGDAPEDVHGGLDRALRLEWGRPSRTRLVFHMADAPGHGCDLHEYSSDEFPSGDPKNRTLEDLFAKLERMEIDYAFGNITSDTAIMVEAFAEARNDTIKTFDLGYARYGGGGGGRGYSGGLYDLGGSGDYGASPPGAAGPRSVKSRIYESVKAAVRESVAGKLIES